MSDSNDVDLIAQMTAGAKGTLIERMGIELVEVTPGRVVARMPVEGNTQPYGLLHGGASVVLAETVGSIAASLAAGKGRAAMGLEINSTHHRGVRSGTVTATATALSEGRSVATYDITIVDDEGRRVNTSRLTCVLRDAPTKAS
ncbi:PaaI family thioesterase [Demetria terragena]|uniref:PaaI family thioesterase n=1 Tax=Demetria terragena TaxID=63959 RepID=UPI00037538A3|nr:hotdog fold thioesterase [Demetria terragena]